MFAYDTSVESNKTLGGIGALLVAIGSFFPFLSLVGIVLVLVAMKGLGDYYKDDSLFKNALYGFVCGLIGIVAAIALFVLFFLSFIIPNAPPNGFFPVAVSAAVDVQGFLTLILALAVVVAFFVLQAVFYRRAFEDLAIQSDERMFRTAGFLLLLGAILTVVVVGFVLLFVGWIVATVAFFAIKPSPKRKEGPPLPPSIFSYTTNQEKPSLL